MFKSKTVWTGLASIITGIGFIITGDKTGGIQLIYTGATAIFLRHAIEKNTNG